jgi:hypothetical protein
MPFLNEIAAKLEQDHVGKLNVTLGIGSRTAIPANLGKNGGPAFFIVIRETGGTGAARSHQTAMERPTAQVMAYGVDSVALTQAITAAYDSLGGATGLYNFRLSGTRYVSLTTRQRLIDLGLDDTGNRAMVAFNIDAEKEPS